MRLNQNSVSAKRYAVQTARRVRKDRVVYTFYAEPLLFFVERIVLGFLGILKNYAALLCLLTFLAIRKIPKRVFGEKQKVQTTLEFSTAEPFVKSPSLVHFFAMRFSKLNHFMGCLRVLYCLALKLTQIRGLEKVPAFKPDECPTLWRCG
ncbi:hypothetical protein [Neisseria iguanae]|uniref:hypothetical protein n=1 Tax=Neisseria iguanae TaxID=90242 RepID=UPI0011B1DDD7|nr:hypothetical protein [Neisseria iguanae]